MIESVGLVATGAVGVLSLLALAGYTGRGWLWMSHKMTAELTDRFDVLADRVAEQTEAFAGLTECVRDQGRTSAKRWEEHTELHTDRRAFGRERESELVGKVQALEVDVLRVKLQVEQAHPHG